jgi:hypothetical protein
MSLNDLHKYSRQVLAPHYMIWSECTASGQHKVGAHVYVHFPDCSKSEHNIGSLQASNLKTIQVSSISSTITQSATQPSSLVSATSSRAFSRAPLAATSISIARYSSLESRSIRFCQDHCQEYRRIAFLSLAKHCHIR